MFDHADADGDGTMAFGEISKVLSKAMATAMSVPVRIIVPSTRDISGQISAADMAKRTDATIALMAGAFGGATASAPQRAAFRADSGDIVFEEVVSVTSFCTPVLWEQKCGEVRAKVASSCKEWGQECIGLDFAGHGHMTTDPTRAPPPPPARPQYGWARRPPLLSPRR